MTNELKLPRLARDQFGTTIELREASDGMTLSFPLSSEAPVERWFGTEVLSHDPAHIRMGRIDGNAAPLLFNHNWDDPVGMVTGGRVQDGRLIVDARLFDTPRAREIKAMMDGGLRNVSIGYDIHAMEEDSKGKRYTATDWEPLEASIVTVPADTSVGIGRSAEDKIEKSVRITRAEPEAVPPAKPAITVRQEPKMAEVIETPAGQNADTRSHDAAAGERLRIATIEKMAREHKVDPDTTRSWINDGVSTDDAALRVLDVLTARAGEAKKVAPSDIGLTRAETEKFSVMNAVRAVINKDWSKAGLELEAHKAIQQRMGGNPLNEHTFYVPLEVQSRSMKRDMTVAGASGSNYLVGTENMGFIDLLRNRSVAMRMGARMMSGMIGNVTVPRQTAASSTSWLSTESTAITESQPTIGQLSLSPKHVGAYTEITRLLALQSSPDAESLVMSDLAQAVALAVDLAALSGSGAAGQPTGITATAGVGAVTGTSLAYAGLLEFQTDIGNALREGAPLGYVTTAAVAALLAARVKVASTYSPLWDGSLLNASVCGFAGMSSAQVAAATMIFGDWSQLLVAEWGSLAIEVNPYANFQAGIIGVRALYAVDVGVRIPGAFSVASSIT